MKRLFALLLVLTLMLPNVGAWNNCAENDSSTRINHCINEVTFNEVFNNESNLPVKSNSEPEVEYSYKLVPISGGDDTKYDTVLTFTLTVAGNEYNFETSGISRKSYYNDDFSVLFGDLEGTITINGKNYTVTVGFVKSTDGDEITAGVSLIPDSYTDFSEVTRFSFGDQFMTPENLGIDSESTGYRNENIASMQIDSRANYVLQTSKTVGFESASGGRDVPSGSATKTVFKYDNNIGRAAVGVFTMTDNITTSFTDYDNSYVSVASSVESATIGLKRIGDTVLSIQNIDSISNGQTLKADNEVFRESLKTLASHFIDEGVGADLLLDVFDKMLIKAGKNFTAIGHVLGSNSYVEFDNGIFNPVKFDDVPLSVSFNLSTNVHPGVSDFVAYTSVSYVTTVSWPDSYEYYTFHAKDCQTTPIALTIK